MSEVYEHDGVVETGDTITIPVEHYDEILDDVRFLNALRAAGVDNWDGYDYALEIYNEEENNDA